MKSVHWCRKTTIISDSFSPVSLYWLTQLAFHTSFALISYNCIYFCCLFFCSSLLLSISRYLKRCIRYIRRFLFLSIGFCNYNFYFQLIVFARSERKKGGRQVIKKINNVWFEWRRRRRRIKKVAIVLLSCIVICLLFSFLSHDRKMEMQ